MDLKTGLVITAPHEVQALAVPLLKRYSPHLLVIYPACITVLYPFVPLAHLDEACAALRDVCADLQPFEITLAGYDHFPRTIFMNPINPEPIRQLFCKIRELFPDYAPYGGEFGTDIHPHLTVAMFDSEIERQQAIMPDYAPVTFLARRLDVVTGSSRLDLPMLTHTIIPLGR